MKHKTDELSGALLDAAVAKAEGLTPRDYELGSCWYCPEPSRGLIPYGPSTDWAQGGPIIERARIDVVHTDEDGWEAQCPVQDRVYGSVSITGPTPLIAAMRAFVASKKPGEEVER